MNTLTVMNRKNKVRIIVVVLVSLVVLAYGYTCGYQKVCKSAMVEKVVRSGKEINLPKGKVYAEVVDTPASRAQGLSGRTGLKEDEAMLFIFEESGKYGFWMKDMLFPIDIIWINKDGVVVHVVHSATPESYFNQVPPQTFINAPDAKYVLEIKAGSSEKFGLYLGTKVILGE